MRLSTIGAAVKKKIQMALENKKPVEFFCGKGPYFSPDPDWGEHLYINNWQGICAHLTESNIEISILNDFFFRYLEGISISYEAADSLLMNLSAYYGLRRDEKVLQRGDILSEIGVLGREKVGELFRLLRREYAEKNKHRKVRSLNDWLEKIKSDGCIYDLEGL